MATACTQGNRTQHGKPDGVVGCDDQPEAGNGQKGRYGVAERLVVLRKPRNAGGGKGPSFKTGTESCKAREIGAILETPLTCGSCGTCHMLKRRKNPDRDPGSE